MTIGCASAGSRAQEFERWVRHYEQRMELPTHEIIYQEDSQYCSRAWIPTDSGFALAVPTIFYDHKANWRSGCSKGPRYYALHEVCHIQYRHLFLDMTYDEMEKEVDKECIPQYLSF